MSRALEISETLDSGTHILTLVGRLDTNTSAQLKASADRIYAAEKMADIVVDMKGCTYVSSAGLRVIVAMQKRAAAGGSLRFRNVSPEVMEVFTSTGFNRILVFE